MTTIIIIEIRLTVFNIIDTNNIVIVFVITIVIFIIGSVDYNIFYQYIYYYRKYCFCFYFFILLLLSLQLFSIRLLFTKVLLKMGLKNRKIVNLITSQKTNLATKKLYLKVSTR